MCFPLESCMINDWYINIHGKTSCISMQIYLKYTSYFFIFPIEQELHCYYSLGSSVFLQHITISWNYVPLEAKTRMSWKSGDSDLLFFTNLGKSD